MRGLNLDQMHAFANVIELGSFSAAAARQNLSQPAISQQIRQLEDRLGVRLIERVGKRAMPTPAGQALLDRVGEIDASVQNALDAVAGFASGTVGQVRIGTGATACIYFLPKVLEQLQRRFPKLEIIVRTGNTSDVLKSIEENSLDIGLVTLPASGRSLDIVPVLTDPFVAIFPDGMDVPDLVRPADLADIPLVLYERGGQTRTIVDDWLRAAGVVGHSIMELGSVEAIKELVGAGLGATILPAMGARLGRTQFPIKTRKLAPDLARRLALVVRRDKVMGSGLREVRNGLIAAARDWTGPSVS
ncbi:LysR family transcriptional regulator [Thalassospira xiamenensis]|uniref:DNA-binding transcriptional regulator, LysR family n=1 Tax=Thalassospira xiamenensis TaxID=220697 RepID=A0A285TUV6_9PROT|nr:LysR family transcriptional regulator [Thalassospira xiamenensis]SOC27923.1 DNA-binding transcriptional regulator, LysR family [Thalassospira xiamenensis]